MYMFECEKDYKVTIVNYLKNIGVDCRLPKRLKDDKKTWSKTEIFKKNLKQQEKMKVNIKSDIEIEVPEFVVRACSCIQENIDVEGLFRKAGSASRQKSIKKMLNEGNKLSLDHNVYDTANLLKQFLRELPNPLLPYEYHDIIIRCLLLNSDQLRIQSLLLTCLLLPLEHLNTLIYVMKFLKCVAAHSARNKMNVSNLAIITTPSIMPMNNTTLMNNTKFNYHVRIVQMLIENADDIGVVPDVIINNAENNTGDEKLGKKKGKRSGSITTMFSEIKKFVGNRSGGAVTPEQTLETDDGPVTGLTKRKSSQSYFSSKKMRTAVETVSKAGAAVKTRMSAYECSVNKTTIDSVYPANLHRARSRSHSPRFAVKRSNSERSADPGGSSFGAQKWMQKKLKRCDKGTSTGALERRSSVLYWNRKKRSQNDPPKTQESDLYMDEVEEMMKTDEPMVPLVIVESSTSSPSDHYMKVSKLDYEDIKSRISVIEKRISREFDNIACVESVQLAYEKTLEDSEPLDKSTDQLARRFGKDLKIRGRVIRSPSLRKIGTLRRRSREETVRMSRSCSGTNLSQTKSSSLKRGRPNTVKSGLPSPGTLRNSDHEEAWVSGDAFFANTNLPSNDYSVRSSVIELRNQNAGMVLAKAKMFNSMNSSQESECETGRKVTVRFAKPQTSETRRRQSSRVEMLKMQSAVKKQRINVTPHTNKYKWDEKENMVSPPLSTTPAIKQSLVTRSPRSVIRTPGVNTRIKNTPMKVLGDHGVTPHRICRKSPRLLAMSNSAKKLMK